MKFRSLTLGLILLGLVGVGLGIGLLLRQPEPVTAAPAVYASPVHAGCYIAAPGDCRIHTEPLSINIQPGSKLVKITLVAINMNSGAQTNLYDFRPDQSEPLPYTGSVVNLSAVSQDFGASCGKSYQVSLQGNDTLDGGNLYNLGLTHTFTCPAAMP